MTVYAVGQITITDRASYDLYQARFMEVFNQFAGTLLAVDDAPQAIEGTWPHTRFVLISFPDEGAFRAWFNSPAYQDIVRHRWAGSTAVLLLAKGFD